MKKKICMILGTLILFASANVAYSKPAGNTELAEAIKLYKAGNYSQCYIALESIIAKDTGNALAYYYKAMASTQLGKKDEAIENYENAIMLTPTNNNLARYAKKGKRCLETPEKCEESLFETIEDEFIQTRNGAKSSEQVRSGFEKLKLENFMREMNRSEEIDVQKFREYKDFSSVPTNDEIVAAMRVLQNAGLSGYANNYADISALTGNNSYNPMMNLMGSSSMNPQLIQALLTNNMAQGF